MSEKEKLEEKMDRLDKKIFDVSEEIKTIKSGFKREAKQRYIEFLHRKLVKIENRLDEIEDIENLKFNEKHNAICPDCGSEMEFLEEEVEWECQNESCGCYLVLSGNEKFRSE